MLPSMLYAFQRCPSNILWPLVSSKNGPGVWAHSSIWFRRTSRSICSGLIRFFAKPCSLDGLGGLDDQPDCLDGLGSFPAACNQWFPAFTSGH